MRRTAWSDCCLSQRGRWSLWERELIDLLEGYGGETRLDPKAAEWKRCNYLIRSYDGRDMQQRELIQSDKVTKAVRQQGLYEAGTRAFPLVIIENEQAVFDLIVRKSGGAAAAAAPAATTSSSASTQSLPPEHGIVKTARGLPELDARQRRRLRVAARNAAPPLVRSAVRGRHEALLHIREGSW